MGVGTGILYFLPVLTGAIADKYGYKRMLFIAFSIYASAFILLPLFNTFTGVFIMYLYLAVGAALFKPVISATIAKTTNDTTSSIGFGILYDGEYWCLFGPMVTLLYKSNYTLVFIYRQVLLRLTLSCYYFTVNREEQNQMNLFQQL